MTDKLKSDNLLKLALDEFTGKKVTCHLLPGKVLRVMNALLSQEHIITLSLQLQEGDGIGYAIPAANCFVYNEGDKAEAKHE